MKASLHHFASAGLPGSHHEPSRFSVNLNGIEFPLSILFNEARRPPSIAPDFYLQRGLIAIYLLVARFGHGVWKSDVDQILVERLVRPLRIVFQFTQESLRESLLNASRVLLFSGIVEGFERLGRS